MSKHITSVKDLVFESLSNFSIIKTYADKGNDGTCFKMGMIHLLGINMTVDFKKAANYFKTQSLASDQESCLLLGFIAELEGKFSQAFHYYERVESSEKDSYLDKVIKGRNKLQEYLKKLDLPITVNKDISTILGNYSKGKASKVGACVKIAAICNDEASCLQAARILYDTKDYITAIQWLQKGNVGPDNPLYAAINNSFEKSRDALLHSKEMKVIDFDGNALLSSDDPTPFFNKVKKTCEAASMKSSIEWKDNNKKLIGKIIRTQKEKEKKERLEAEAAEKARKRKKKQIIKHLVIIVFLFMFGVFDYKELGVSNGFIGGVMFVLSCYFWFYLIRWIWRCVKN